MEKLTNVYASVVFSANTRKCRLVAASRSLAYIAAIMNIILPTQREQERIEGRAPLIEWNSDDYTVADGNLNIGRIYKTRLPTGDRWCWFLQTAPIAPPPNTGSCDTLDDARAVLAARYEAVR